MPNSIATEITRITTDRNTIRTKFVALGIATSNADLDDLATAADGIVNRGAVDASVQEGESYTIPAGYHNGAGTVRGVSGGGNYSLQAKTVTPTTTQQAVSPDAGYYGLSGVTVNAIPSNYKDVSSVTATAADVLANKIIVGANGTAITGTMPNNGTITTQTLDATTGKQSYTIPAGKHSGSGKVQIVLEEKTATPTTSAQTITPTNGKVLSKVTVNPIPSNYVDKTGATAISETIDGLTTTSVTIAEGYTLGGTVSLTDDIYNALAAI